MLGNMHLNYDFEAILDQLPDEFNASDLLGFLTISDDEAIRICGKIPTASIDMGRILHMLDVVDILKDLKLIREYFNDLPMTSHDISTTCYKKL